MKKERLPHHLPISHPEYRYSPSQNPYWKKLSPLEPHAFLDHQTEAHQGHWREQFPKGTSESPLHVELGCNGGHVVLKWAERNPKDLWIGIDWKFKQIYRAYEKAQKRKLKNVIFFRSHGERLHYMFGKEEIDFLYLYFPDPWPKKSQWKHRTVREEWLRNIAPLLKKTGRFHIKTDHAGYFEWMEEELGKVSDIWEIEKRSTDLHRDHPDPIQLEIPEVTLFERIFIRERIPIHSLLLKRKAKN